MKRFALLTATLMLGGAAIAQDTGYEDPATPDTAVSSDTATQADTTTTDTEATTTSSTDVMSDTDAAAESTTTTTDTTSTDTMTTTTSTDATGTTTTTTTATGVGGPYEPAPTASMPVASAIPSPTSKGGYPPCDGSESADSCIQLYERGVKSETNLAMNNSLPGGDQTMTASAETATPTGQLSADATMSTTATTSPAEPATGVGGPYEPVEAGTNSKKDYPPCSGAESDDSCIQMYERGVTGADN